MKPGKNILPICKLCSLFIILSYAFYAQKSSPQLPGMEQKADYLSLEEKHKEAIEIYKSILENIRYSATKEKKYQLYFKIGNSLMHSGQELEAQLWFRKLISEVKTGKNPCITSDAMNGLGRTHEYIGNRDSAFYWYLKSYELISETTDTLRRARGLRNMAQLLRVLNKYHEANIYCQQAIQLIPGITDHKVIANIYNETAYLFELSEQYDSAAYYYEQLINISLKNNYLKGQSVGYTNLASVFEKTNRIEEALTLKLKGLEIDRQLNDVYGMMTSFISLAESYMSVNNNPQALENLNEAFTICDTSWIVDLSNIHYLYYKLFRKMGNPDQTLIQYEKHIALRDRINNNKSRENVMDLLAQYENEKKEQQILMLGQTNHIQKNKLRIQWILIGALVMLGMLIIVTTWLWIKQKNQRLRQKQIEIQQLLLREKESNRLNEKKFTSKPFDNYKKWGLTTRECEILYHMSNGCSNAKIAENLFISENTVKFHIKNIYIKLNVKSRMEAVMKCS